MSEVIDRVKDKYPEYRDVPDDQLTLKIAEKYPEYLDRDPQFKADYQNHVANAVANAPAISIGLAQQSMQQLIGTLTNPAAGVSAQVGREAPPAPPQPAPEPTDSLRPQTAFERFRFGPIGQALLGKTSLERDLENKGAMGPIEGLTHSIKALDLSPRSIVEASRQFTAAQLGVDPDKLAPAPTDESVAAAMKSSKVAALSIGAIKGLEDMDNFFTSPLGAATLGTSAFPKLAQRMIAVGFAAQMASGVPEIAKQLGDELGKNPEDRDYQKIGNLTVSAATAVGFSAAGVLHGVGPGIKGELTEARAGLKSAADKIQGVAPNTAQALKEEGDAIHSQATKVLQSVQSQPGESKGEVSAKGAGAETGTRSEPVAPKKSQQAIDYDRFQELQQAGRGKTLDEMQAQGQEMEDIKRRYGGFPPQPPEQITHAAVLDLEGYPRLGPNHPEVLKRMGVEGFESRESRNKPQFGFWTNRGRFVSREQAGQIATEAGQNLGDFEPGEKVHSDQIKSRVDPSQTLGDAPAETYPVPDPIQVARAGLTPPVIQAGAAHVTEVPVTGIGADVTGISAKIRAERAKAGQVVAVKPGRGINVPDSVERGREILAADPDSGERMLQQFEADPDKKIWHDLVATTRAHSERLAMDQRWIEEQFGTDSPEWREAKAAVDAFDTRTKPIQTEWHKTGEAQQGWTDLDTGSVGGLERERKRVTGEDFTEGERKEAEGIAAEVRKDQAETDEAAAKVNTEIQNTAPSPEVQLQEEQKLLHDVTTDANAAAEQEAAAQRAIDAANKVVREAAVAVSDKETADRVAQAKRDVDTAHVQRDAAQKAIDEANKTLREAATAGADQETKDRVEKAKADKETAKAQKAAAEKAIQAANKAVRDAARGRASKETQERVAQAKRDIETAKVQKEAARKAKQSADKVVRRLAADMAKTEAKVKARKVLDDQAKAARNALQASHNTLRDHAVRLADAENKAREAQTVRDKQAADVQVKAAQKAQDAVWKQVRDHARRLTALERKIVGDGAIPVWDKARKYLQAFDEDGRAVPSNISFDDLRNKIAADLGLPVEQVTRLLARSKRMKFLTDDLWLKQQRERNTKTKAKLWVAGLDTPGYEKFFKGIPRTLFRIRVGLHGTVALGTHAPAVAFDPRFWGTYVRNFGKMYKLVLNQSFYEAQMQDLVRRKNFATGKRSGLINDPYKFEDFSHPGIAEDAAQKMRESFAKATGLDPRLFTKAGDRGYSILKILRQDMFDHHWDHLPRQMQTEEMGKAIADAVNHITGVVQTPAPLHAEMVAFAPKLLMSRFAFLFGDPMRAGVTGLRAAVGAGMKVSGYEGKLPQMTDAEKWFAINEAKTKVYTAGTLVGLLALNQGILTMAGSNQKVNWTNPFKSDFGKFKVAGLNLSYGNALLTAARLPIRLGSLGIGTGGKLGKLIYPDENAAKMVWEYFRSQLSPAAALTADMVWREDWMGRQMWFSDRTEPKRLQAQGVQPYTPGEYIAQQAAMIPLQEVLRETWKNGFGINEETAKAIMGALFMAGTGARISKDPNAEHAQQ